MRSGLGIPQECPVSGKLLPSSSTLTFDFEIYNVKSGLIALFIALSVLVLFMEIGVLSLVQYVKIITCSSNSGTLFLAVDVL